MFVLRDYEISNKFYTMNMNLIGYAFYLPDYLYTFKQRLSILRHTYPVEASAIEERFELVLRKRN